MGSYPEGTINRMVDTRLREMLESMKKFSGSADKDDKK